MANMSKTKLKLRMKKKTKPALAAAVALAMKSPSWIKYAKIISVPTRKHANINLGEIDLKTSTGDSILVIGKVLSLGEITKKIRVISLSISESAREKLKKTKSEWVSLIDEIKSNPRAEGLKIIK